MRAARFEVSGELLAAALHLPITATVIDVTYDVNDLTATFVVADSALPEADEPARLHADRHARGRDVALERPGTRPAPNDSGGRIKGAGVTFPCDARSPATCRLPIGCARHDPSLLVASSSAGPIPSRLEPDDDASKGVGVAAELSAWRTATCAAAGRVKGTPTSIPKVASPAPPTAK